MVGLAGWKPEEVVLLSQKAALRKYQLWDACDACTTRQIFFPSSFPCLTSAHVLSDILEQASVLS